MRQRFPQFVLRRAARGLLLWDGVIEPHPGVSFRISVEYPPTYPYQEPVLRVDDPPLRAGAPHRYIDGSICIHKHHWDPATGTAASLVPLVAAWLVAYIHWTRTGEGY